LWLTHNRNLSLFRGISRTKILGDKPIGFGQTPFGGVSDDGAFGPVIEEPQWPAVLVGWTGFEGGERRFMRYITLIAESNKDW